MEENKRQVKSSNVIAKKNKKVWSKAVLARDWNIMRITQEESRLQGIFTDFLKSKLRIRKAISRKIFLVIRSKIGILKMFQDC